MKEILVLLLIILGKTDCQLKQQMHPTTVQSNVLSDCSLSVCYNTSFSDCTNVWKECECGNGIVNCPKTKTCMTYEYNRFNRYLSFHGPCLREYHNLEAYLLQAAKLFNSLKVSKFSFLEFSDQDTKISTEDSLCPPNGIVFDVNKFHETTVLQVLELPMNCFGIIEGNFAKVFPTLRGLNLSFNRLSNLTQNTFRGLKYLKYLDLGVNNIQVIDRRAFQDLIYLQTLLLETNNIFSLSVDTFTNLSKLRTLSLSQNLLTSLPKDIFANNQELTTLYLNDNSIQEPHQVNFSSLKKLKKLNLSTNNISFIKEDIVAELQLLQELSLDHNNLKTIPKQLLLHNTNINTVSFISNPLGKIPQFEQKNLKYVKPIRNYYFQDISLTYLQLPLSSYLASAESVMLSENCIESINKSTSYHTYTPTINRVTCWNCCFQQLPKALLMESKELDLTFNDLSKLTMKDLENVVQLDEIDLSYNEIEHVEVEWQYPIVQDGNKPIQNPQTKIIINTMSLMCDCHLFPLLMFMHRNTSTLLPHQQFSNIHFDIVDSICANTTDDKLVSQLRFSDLLCHIPSNEGCPTYCLCSNHPAEQITIVNCSSTNQTKITYSPSFEYLVALHLQNNNLTTVRIDSTLTSMLKEIHLTNNRFSHLQINDSLIKLSVLYVNNNLLEEIPQLIFQLLSENKNIRIALSGNPLKCNCELLQHKQILLNYENIVDVSNITCVKGDNRTISLINSKDRELCVILHQDNNLIIKVSFPVFIVFGLLISIVIVLLSFYKSELKYWLYIHGLCLKFVTEEHIDLDKKYDAFVSYSAKDEDWIADHLVPELENGTPAYKLCLHERDWLPGEWIPEQITQSVKNSRRTLIILTPNFVQSEWSRLEFLASYQQMVEDKINRLIVIVPEDLPNITILNEELQNYITTTTYLKWNQSTFWWKLKCSMPRVQIHKQNETVA